MLIGVASVSAIVMAWGILLAIWLSELSGVLTQQCRNFLASRGAITTALAHLYDKAHVPNSEF